METEFINITEENADTEHLCCIIRTRTAHPGVETKRRWLKDRLKEGHVFRKLNINGTVFIEYAPLETAWVPITGDNFYYILPMGDRCAERTRLRQTAYGVLHKRCKNA